MSRILSFLSLSLLISPAFSLTLKRGNMGEPTSLDPHLAADVHSCAIVRDLHEGLVNVDAKTGGPALAGALKMSVSEDGLTYTFTLKARTWSDGSPLTAHDYVYGFKRAQDKATASPYAHLFAPIADVKALGDLSLEISLKYKAPYFLAMLTHTVFVPMHQKSIEKWGKDFVKPGHMISSGAYVLDSWKPHDVIIAKKNNHYPLKTNIDEVHYMAIEDGSLEYKNFLTGAIDMTASVPDTAFDAIAKDKKIKAMYHTNPYYSVIYLTLNEHNPKLQNLDVRKAIDLAINREVLTEKITKTGEIPIYSYTPHAKAQLADKNLSPAARHEKAKTLLTKAGYSKEKPLNITYSYNITGPMKKIALALKGMLEKDLPLKVALDGLEWKAFLNSRKDLKTAEISRAGLVSLYDDPYCFLEIQSSNSGMNDGIWKDKTYDDLLNASNREPQNRNAFLEQAEQRLLDSYTLLPLYQGSSKHLIKPYVKGYYGNLLDIFYTKDLSIEA